MIFFFYKVLFILLLISAGSTLLDSAHPTEWSKEDVKSWLEGQGFDKEAEMFEGLQACLKCNLNYHLNQRGQL